MTTTVNCAAVTRLHYDSCNQKKKLIEHFIWDIMEAILYSFKKIIHKILQNKAIVEKKIDDMNKLTLIGSY